MVDTRQVITDDYAIYNDDCIRVLEQLKQQGLKIGFSIYSPPFANQTGGGVYRYSSSPLDLSNSRSYDEFMQHYDYTVRGIHDITPQGRLTAVHCMDTPMSNTGRGDGIIDFPGDVIELHTMCRNENCTAGHFERKHGFCGHGLYNLSARHSIWKEPLAVRNRTMSKKLAHKTIVDDSSKCGVAGADYLLVFRKNGENQTPIAHPTGLHYYAGESDPPANTLKYKGWTGSQIENKYSHWIWRQYASSVWDDIRVDNVLDYDYDENTDDDYEKHVHPLQLDVIERAVTLYSNHGEVVFTPYMGVGSEVYGAVKLGRRGIGAELKETYFRQAARNLEDVQVQENEQLKMF